LAHLASLILFAGWLHGELHNRRRWDGIKPVDAVRPRIHA
jgi:hypothetical protein